MKVLAEGQGELHAWMHPDEARKWMRDNKTRALVDKRMTIKEAVERFTKDDNSWATASDGMGIGLSLSKLIIEQMGGRIKARNRKNGGAEVWFDLNLKYSNTQTV